MASSEKNLSEFDFSKIPSAKDLQFGIVIADWNPEITQMLHKGVIDTLIANGASIDNIETIHVPGSFELPLGAQILLEPDDNDFDAIICIGCIIQGETRHFEFISNSVAQGIMNVGLHYHTPVIFGVLTTDSKEQARDRAGGKYGNKGVEAAVSAIKMAYLNLQLDHEEE